MDTQVCERHISRARQCNTLIDSIFKDFHFGGRIISSVIFIGDVF